MHIASLKLLLSFLILFLTARPYIIVLSEEDLKESTISCNESPDWDEFVDFDSPHKSEDELDPGSWHLLFDPASSSATGSFDTSSEFEALYISGVSKMISAASSGDARLMQEAAAEIEAAACEGHPHSRSVLGFLHGMGMMRERNKAKAFLYHHFAAEGGNMQSKMALAYSYSRQEMYESAIKLYAELAEVAVNSLWVLKDFPVIAPVRIHHGAEENVEVLRKSRGEDNEVIEILEYQALQGHAGAMYKIGLFYYVGLRGLKRDHAKAIPWFLKAVEKGEPRSMELLGEIYARGVGVERNYRKALEWLTLASKHPLYSAYNGMGYMYIKGYGVANKNYTKAKEYFEKAANDEDAGGLYNLGVMYLKGIAVKKDSRRACSFFIQAANAGHQKAFYQLAKMFHTGLGLKKNLPMATAV